MRFSVLIPAYNLDLYLRDCIESVLVQSFEDYEIIVIDDGSTDDTLKIAREYENSSRFSVYSRQNKGISATRIELAEYAKGDYLLFIDADDYIEKDTLQILDREIEESQCDVVYFDYYKFTDNGDRVECRQEGLQYGVKLESKSLDILYNLFCTNSLNSMCRKAIRRESFVSLPLTEYQSLQLNMGEDFFFTLLLMLHEVSVFFIPNLIYSVRLHAQSMCATHSVRRLNSDILLYNLICDLSLEDEFNKFLDVRKTMIVHDVIEQLLRSKKINYRKIRDVTTLLIDNCECIRNGDSKEFGKAHRMLHLLLMNGHKLLASLFCYVYNRVVYQ